MSAKTHTHQSNRAKAHSQAERKAVYKPFLAMVITLVEGMAIYRAGKKRKRTRGEGRHQKKKRNGATEDMDEPQLENEMPVVDDGVVNKDLGAEGQLEPPSVLEHLITGINEVTRSLEGQLTLARTPVTISGGPNPPASKDPQTANASASTTTQTPLSPRIKLIFICRADIDPPLLIAHIPPLVATHNSISRVEDAIKLVTLPRGAEASLGAALGLRRVAVLAVTEGAERLDLFGTLLPSVPTLTAPWRVPTTSLKLAPTRVKQVRTSAPKDMKAAKEERAKGRAAAKLKAKTLKGAKGRYRVVVHAATATSSS
ncbi:hypothetical protein HWV62_20152 [Athelia sp. TMB]|nr:hypothetical protein HWV62_20152 [Athelia sp. TMB]